MKELNGWHKETRGQSRWSGHNQTWYKVWTTDSHEVSVCVCVCVCVYMCMLEGYNDIGISSPLRCGLLFHECPSDM